MNKKKYYSLTANQRKALRAEEQEKQNRKLSKELAKKDKTNIAAGKEDVVVVKKSHKQLWILITAITVGILLIVTAIILPIVLLSNNSKNPQATIYLDDGRKINFEIWEDSCPITATNFIYLANLGFFDGALVYDAQNNFMRFGATTDYGKTKYKDKTFLDTITNFGLNELSDNYKKSATSNLLGYKLKPDYNSTENSYSTQSGVISYIFKNTADFMINVCSENETNTAFYSQNTRDKEDFSPRAFGRVSDSKSFKILQSIYSMEKSEPADVDYYIALTKSIRIKKIRVTNLKDAKWKNFVFVKYMNTAYNEGSAWNSWSAN